MKGTLILLTAFSTILACCKGQPKTNKRLIYNNDFKWTITIPPNFDTVSAEKWAIMQNRGAEAIEKTHNADVENNSKTIFVFQNDQFNYFEANYQPFDSTIDGNYDENIKQAINIVYQTFEAQMPGARLDSSSSTAIISGLRFQTFKVKISLDNNVIMTWQMFSRLFDTKDLTVNIMTMDRQKEHELLEAWTNSKFDH
jgi:hypothetical protein